MGCACTKASSRKGEECVDDRRERVSGRSSRRLVVPSRRQEVEAVDPGAAAWDNGGGGRRRIVVKEENVVAQHASSPKERAVLLVSNSIRKGGGSGRRPSPDALALALPNGVEKSTKLVLAKEGDVLVGIGAVPNGFEAEHVAAGWPSWLAAVAGEAVKGWVPRRADSFERLDKIGQGTYSNVYRALDLVTKKIVALKKVRFVTMDPESVRFMAREIHILRRLDHPNIVKLEGLVTSRMSSSIYLVFEYMEHDLAGLAATPGIKFTESQVKCYMQQLLRGLDHCHSSGVLHRDIKGSNLLIDNNGILRIADFGLATFFNPNHKQMLTSRVVTLWYRPPELLLGATEYGISVDLWSAGCILAELLAGKPIMPGRTEVEQLHKIFKLCGSPSEEYWRRSKLPHATIFKPQLPYPRRFGEVFQDFPPPALALLDSLLAIEPEDRGTASSSLKSEFFTTKPLACDPSTLPKYPPSKELDAKLRDEEARRQRSAAIKGRGSDVGKKAPRESRAVPVPDANAEMKASLQKRQIQANPKSSSEKYNSREEAGSGFPIDPPKTTTINGFSQCGPLLRPGVHGTAWNKQGTEFQNLSCSTFRPPSGPQLRTQRSYAAYSEVSDMSNHSGLIAARSSANSRYGHFEVVEPSDKLLERPSSSRKKDERPGNKESTLGYNPKRNIIHYSGPLMPTGGNIDEMLKEHERHIQHAVRKSRGDRTKTKKAYGDRGQFEVLLIPARK